MKDNKLFSMDLQMFAGERGLLSKGTKLGYKAGGGSTYTDVKGLQSTPEVGGDPEQVEVTDLSDSKKRYVSGLQDVDTLEFGVLYDSAVFGALETLQSNDTSVDWELAFPDGSKFTFKGKPTVKMGGAEVNGALAFTLSIVVSEGPDFVPTV
ncbi:phage tail tube protein [Enterococcus sp. AZ109]|uniref:phage tail tube protein n=1 Tax=Enterococcus sp. AZ109 TaxID=2774634 RepID=UPI003F24D0D7